MNNADIAHLEEHLTCNEDVDGSKPSVGSKCKRCNGSGIIRKIEIHKILPNSYFTKQCPDCSIKKIKTKVCSFCHGSGLCLIRGKIGDIVYCPECLGNGYVAN